MKLPCANNNSCYVHNKQKRRWYKKVRWVYRKNKTTNTRTCHGHNKFGSMFVKEINSHEWYWVANVVIHSIDPVWKTYQKVGVATSQQLAQKRSLEAVRGLVGL